MRIINETAQRPKSIQSDPIDRYAGPHDYLNSWLYDPITGNIRTDLNGFERFIGEVGNIVNVGVATPFMAASLIPDRFESVMRVVDANNY